MLREKGRKRTKKKMPERSDKEGKCRRKEREKR